MAHTPTHPDHERLLSYAVVHTVSVHHDDGTVVLGVTERDPTLPLTARVDGEELRVVQESRPRPRALAGEVHRDVVADARTGARDARQRPLAGGLQIALADGTSGTLGAPMIVADPDRDSAVWRDSVSVGDVMLASNRHVLKGNLGDSVYQPFQGSGNKIGEIAGYVPLEDGTRADVAAIDPADDLDLTDYSYWELDNPDRAIQRSGYYDSIGSDVTVTGATSGVASGVLQDVDVTVAIDYDDFGEVTVYGTNETRDISQGGDSGAPRFNDPAASLLDLNFASDTGYQSGGHAWGTTIRDCEQALGVRFVTSADLRERAASGSGYVARAGAYYAAGGAYTGPGGGGGTVDPPSEPDPTPEPEPEPEPGDQPPGGDGTGVGNPPFQFATTLNAVDDLGMDPTGSQPIDGQMDLSDNTLIEFPPGDYLISDGFNTDNGNALVGLRNWGLVGLGDTRGDVRFHTTPGEGRALFVWGLACENIYLANLTLDQSDSRATSVRVNFNGEGGLYAYNTQLVGYQPNDNECGPPDNNAENAFRVQCSEPDGVAEIINHKNTVDTTVISYPLNGSGLGSYQGHQGTVYLRNAWVANKGEHAYYASRPEGSVRIEGGLFENCANTNMRICGGGSWAKGATVRIDRDVSYFTQADDGVVKSARGLRWESGGNTGGQTGGYVEDCDFLYITEKVTPGLVRVEGNAGSMAVRNCRLYSENDSGPVAYVEAIGAGPDGIDPPDPDTPVVFDGCDFTGSTSSPPVESDRPNTIADGCCNGLSAYQNVAVTNPASGPCDDPTA